jgi:tetratricopeptide (TPR) repeat protein
MLSTGLVLLSLLCAPVAMALPAVSGALPQKTGDRLIQESEFYPLAQGADEVRQGNDAAALPYLIKSLEQNPTNLITLFHLGNSYLELAKQADIPAQRMMFLQQAQQNFERVLDLNAELTLAYFKMGKIALMVNDLENAKRYYELGLQEDPKNAALVFNLARVYDQANDKDKAMALYRQAIQLDPQFVYAYNNLALLYEDKKDWKSAAKYYKEALHQDAGYTLSHINLGNLYASSGRYSAAEKELNQAIAQEPDNEWAIFYLGNVYMKQSKYGPAVEMYRKAIALNPGHTSVYYLMAVALSRLNRMDDALQASLQYMQREPEGEFSKEMKSLIMSVKLSQSHGVTVLPKTAE